jgi:NhaP-type Na+/H+ or K+/H+ antiporter
MVVGGALAGNLVLPHLPTWTSLSLSQVSSPARQTVLALILLRAGLGLSQQDYRQASGLTLSLGLIPLLGDAAFVTLGGVALFGLPLPSAVVLGFLVAAISPAIVIPGMMELLDRRRGSHRRVPAALLAGAPLDNVVAVVALGVALDLALAQPGAWHLQLVRIPQNVLGGALIGAVVGVALALPLRGLRGRAVEVASVVVWAAGALLFPLCGWLGLSAVIAALVVGSVARALAPRQVLPLSGGLTRAWYVAQYVLFGLIGASFSLGAISSRTVVAGLAVVLIGQIGRAGGVLLATSRSSLSHRERLACVLAYLPKATIQAAFAGLPLDRGLPEGQILLSTAVLAILILAPLGVVTLHRGVDALLPGGSRS